MHEHKRLSDDIATALSLAIEQGDLAISEHLMQALELALTRNAGGPDFVERRDFHTLYSDVMTRFETLKDQKSR